MSALIITGAEGTGSAGGSAAPTYTEVKAAIGAANSALDMNGQQVVNSATPTTTAALATKGYVDTAVAAVSGGAAFSFSPVDLYTVGADYLGDYTTGGRYVAMTAVTITGVRFTRFVNAATMSVKLWKGGVAAATASQVVTTGIYSVTFGTPVALVAGEEFYVTTYDGGTRYAKNNSAPSFDPSWSTGLIIPFGAKVALIAPSYYAAGDAQPNTSGGERFPVEPIY